MEGRTIFQQNRTSRTGLCNRYGYFDSYYQTTKDIAERQTVSGMIKLHHCVNDKSCRCHENEIILFVHDIV